jgi:valyl-tRNA synthetase
MLIQQSARIPVRRTFDLVVAMMLCGCFLPSVKAFTRTSSSLLRQPIVIRQAKLPRNTRRDWGLPLSTTTTEEAASAVPDSTDTREAYDVLNRARGLVGSYDPGTFETDIYQWWEQSGCFSPPERKVGEKTPFVIPMPPPNVTGRLHMGHAIFVALQDVLARFHRMRGRPVLWTPGTDHAGIATQLQVEKQLLEEGTTREAVGREEFLERVWAYKAEQGGHIQRQLRSLGASADWSRERFTMDEDLSQSVVEAFCRLHEAGLVYRGEYMVNWAPLLKTAVSDLEVEYSEEEGKLYYFKYMLENSEGKDRKG